MIPAICRVILRAESHPAIILSQLWLFHLHPHKGCVHVPLLAQRWWTTFIKVIPEDWLAAKLM